MFLLIFTNGATIYSISYNHSALPHFSVTNPDEAFFKFYVPSIVINIGNTKKGKITALLARSSHSDGSVERAKHGIGGSMKGQEENGNLVTQGKIRQELTY